MNKSSDELVNTSRNEFNSIADLWSWPALCRATDNPVADGPVIQRVIVDSRQARSGDLFIALSGDPGERFNPSQRSSVDGHDFVADAQQRGASGAMLSRASAVDLPGLPVADTYDGLWSLGAAGRARLQGAVLAITGSSGKTTAKYFFSEALAAFTPPGSFNNHIGVPLALANAPQTSTGAVSGVFEIGTNHPGEIEPLAQLVQPDIAVVLNVHSAHIENFAGRDDLFKEKCSIFNSLSNKSNALSEDEMGLTFGLKFGTSSAADAQVLDMDNTPGSASVRIRLFNETVTARVPGGGLHRAKSVAATLLACKVLDLDLQAALNLGESGIPSGRGNRIECGGVSVIDESYNANPDSMRATLEGFGARAVAGRKIVILGEMLELGSLSRAAHLGLAPLLNTFDEVICVGAGAEPLAASIGAPWYADSQAVLHLAGEFQAGDEVLVKGSNRVFWAHGFIQKLCAHIIESR